MMIENATFISCQMRHKIAFEIVGFITYHLDYHTCAVRLIKESM